MGSSSDEADWQSIEAALHKAGQAHVLQPPAPPERRAAFLTQLRSLDLDSLPQLLQTSLAHAEQQGAHKELTPFKAETLADIPEAEAMEMRRRGLAMIAHGEVAALLLAGGQGTRLGTTAPKGCYDIGLPSHKSIFQIHAERIRRVKQLAAAQESRTEASVRLPFLVMTSDATDAETRAFFREHAHFGLPEEDVIFFVQGALPCLTPEGKVMLEAPGNLAMAPNGNGGVYMSLRESGLLAKLDAAGVTSIFQFGVDNVLCHVADPTFVGFCAAREADCASKTVPKRDPHEPVGVVALAGGAPAVVEYSEISKELAEATDAEGRLLFGSVTPHPLAAPPDMSPSGPHVRLTSQRPQLTTASLHPHLAGQAHICVNFFSMAFLRTFCETLLSTLPLHVARKKIPYVDTDGTRVTPTSNNGVKLELFIFDTFPHAKRMAALEVPREAEFAPVKNPPGAASDSPDTARQMIYALSKARIRAAGGALASEGEVEVSPLLSYQGEGLEERVSGQTLSPPVHLEVGS